MQQIPFSPPDITEDEIAAVADTLRSGWITTGPKTKEFEQEIAAYCETQRAVCLNSATASLECALRLLGVGPGDEVIVPAYTYTATVSPVCHVGATPIMIDCADGSFGFDFDKVAAAINGRTKAIISVDLGGIIADYDSAYAIAEAASSIFIPSSSLQEKMGRIAIIADAAHSFGATQSGKRSGCIADFSSFSFHAVKNLTTGEGGALTWNLPSSVDDDELYRECQLLSLHGQNKDALSKTRAGSWEYDIVAPYYKWNMTDIMASIGLVQLNRYPVLLEKRRELYTRYLRNIADDGKLGETVHFRNHYSASHQSSGHLMITRLDGFDENMRNEFITMMAQLGVICNVHYKPLPMMTAYKSMGFDISNFQNAKSLFENEITLPLYSKLSFEEADYVSDCFLSIYDKLAK